MIFELTIRNFRRIQAAHVVVTKAGLVPVTGKNGNGKSSFTDAISAVIGGLKAIPAVETPIHRGATRSEIILKTDEFTAERVFTKRGTEFKVTGSDRIPWKRPQEVFDAMLARFAFDIPGFLRLTGTAQRDAALAAFGLAEPLAKLKVERDQVYSERTDANRERHRLEALLQAAERPIASAPDHETSASEILAELQEASDVNTANGLKRDELRRATEVADRAKDDVERLARELAAARTRQAEAGIHAEQLELEVMTLVDPDLAAINVRLADVEQSNRAARVKAAWTKLQREVNDAVDRAEELDAQLRGIESRKAALVKSAEIPVVGLEITEEGLSLHGLPFTDASKSQRLGVACEIAMAPGAGLPILRIADGADFDVDSLAELDRRAEERGFLVFAERASKEPEGLPNEVFISDGLVVESASA